MTKYRYRIVVSQSPEEVERQMNLLARNGCYRAVSMQVEPPIGVGNGNGWINVLMEMKYDE